jgi:hypothetical protein
MPKRAYERAYHDVWKPLMYRLDDAAGRPAHLEGRGGEGGSARSLGPELHGLLTRELEGTGLGRARLGQHYAVEIQTNYSYMTATADIHTAKIAGANLI